MQHLKTPTLDKVDKKTNTMLNSKSIGNKIATARKKMNLSQAELAQQVSISSQAVGKWERGESLPDITTLNRLAEILGVDLNYFSESFASEEKAVTNAQASVKTIDEFPAFKQKKTGIWNMSAGNWVDADFSGLKNLQEKFSSSNMNNCKFIGSDLSGLTLGNNNIEKCDFSSSDIRDSKIQSSNLLSNQFNNCSFIDAEFFKSNIGKCNFSDANFSGAEIVSVNFESNNVKNAVWKITLFKNTSISDVVFDGTFEDCQFEGCSFYGVKFQNATLINTFFKNNKKLKRVQFLNCKVDKITYAFLKSNLADLTGITLLE